jgi:transcriptional regulator with XRE-family HTH domain
MAAPRALLLPDEATSEGARLLRAILRRQTFGAIARRLGCDESLVRRWAREERRPSRVLRLRAADVLGIPGASWDERART